jgi:ATP-dependent RNA helicase DDX35
VNTDRLLLILSRSEKKYTYARLAYNAFVKYGKSSRWCGSHSLSFRALSRAVSIRAQLKKYMIRFNIPIESCEGDAKRLRRCLVSGLWRNGAKWVADGTYRSVRGNVVSTTNSKIIIAACRILCVKRLTLINVLAKTLHVHPTSVMFTRKPQSGWVVFHEMEETKKTQ